ncbi:hypothetical protein P3T76_012764 [Phytophthora citrophthora]|uniref:Uncharacterized protein n=1 Tax=Phytophthora citrophthora TaxID=4793 RepID=A0AAD9G4G6_9STRA|nr:hypothetical protein P3T76_012764 [Phytophthora citrophthora]
MEYAVHSAPFVTGVIYTTPDARWGPLQGIYVLHCGSTFSFNGQAYDGPNFILKVGKAIDIREGVAQHKSETSEHGCKGTVTFLTGLEVQGVDLSGAESLLKSRLTYFGLARYIVTETQKRTTETFAFNVKSLPLTSCVRYAMPTA